MRNKKLTPVHPGEVLREEFLIPLGLTPYAVALALNVPRTRIERIVREETSVTAETAILLGKYLNTSPLFWINLQGQYDIETAQDSMGGDTKRIVPAVSQKTAA
jgi:addiction module HigA family antidote